MTKSDRPSRSFINPLFAILTSLRLTVVCLGLATLLVFIGTIAQVEEGLYNAQARYFKSFFIWWHPANSSLNLPIFPGGYTVGVLLMMNLVAAHAKRFQLTWKKFGIHLTHGGLILLLLGQLLTDLFSRESAMRMTEGEIKYYSEDFHANELVLIDRSDASQDQVVSIPESMVAKRQPIQDAAIPFTLRIIEYWVNASLAAKETPASIRSGADQGLGRSTFVIPTPPVTSMDERNTPAAVVEALLPGGQSLGKWLVSARVDAPQEIQAGSRAFEVAMRFKRYYKPFSLSLVDFSHDKYMGTAIPKNFSSLVRLKNPATGEDREIKIFMNNPLRYAGLTFYQSGFDENDPRVTILQVVRNPSWLTPYFACLIVGVGLIVQFGMHLLGFVSKRRRA